MPTVFANSRSILHAGDGNKHVAAPPDVCKTPSPGGPVPIPYVNVASDSDLAKGTKKVKIEGKSAAKADANLSTSMGDEAGTAGGGIISSKTKGKLTWATSSPDVKLEGKGAVRFMDVTQHNGNSFNSAFTSLGAAGLCYLDDFDTPCEICGKGPDEHRVAATDELAQKCNQLLQELDKIFRAATTDAERERVAWKAEGETTWNGYMVGMMACKCDPPQYFCTNSGTTYDGLIEAAGKVGATPITGGPANIQQFTQINKATEHADGSRISKKAKGNAVRAAFKKANKNKSAGVGGYNRAGACAGAKLVAKCKHAPLYMCEVYYSPPDTSWTATYNMLVTTEENAAAAEAAGGENWQQDVKNNRHAEKTEKTFSTGDNVASCHTCQETLYLTNCPDRVCPG